MPLVGAQEVLADLRDGDRILGEAHDSRGLGFISEIPVEGSAGP